MKSPYVLLALLLAACGGGGSGGPSTRSESGPGEPAPDPFSLSTSRTVPFEALIDENDQPLAGAIVLVMDTQRVPAANSGQTPEDLTEGRVYFRGLTDSRGRVSRELCIPSRVQTCDVIVQARGLHGPYTEESLRTEAGLFAPSSRVRFAVNSLNSVSISLQ